MDDFILYKTELKKWYHHVKNGVDSRFLLMPAQAKLRNLCIQICRNGKTQDLIGFRNFLGFDFDPNAINKIKERTEDFKKIARFLKDKSVLADPEPVEMLAVLIDFPYRPYQKFLENKDRLEDLYTSGPPEVDVPFPEVKIDTESKEEGGIDKTEKKKKKKKYPIIFIFSNEGRAQIREWGKAHKKRIAAVAGTILILGTGFYGTKLYHQKAIIRWNKDHYEIASDGKVSSQWDQIGLMDTAQFKVRRIRVYDTTTFFKKGKPIIWYSRNNGYEFFNHPGYHPVSRENLKPVSQRIATNVHDRVIKIDY
ncbi:hypothetical protein HUK80_02110 [Flavobacterium sp. MAH-1]|uniref:Uncharacterized protein n=1 Tax=Flavobacterium agri TaxID=2743471 RepID=A0A7Y8XZK5_9FLAO|nr:hypothetical protein [Flavobacterium agri]NUY79675.1 hypothetical protein [Flavobacterium agri]NYA69700.1 hypothetical protein [Flavobacterium agri]